MNIESESIEYLIDFISITINKSIKISDNKINEIYNIFLLNSLKITEEIIISENFEIINQLIKNCKIQKKLISNIIIYFEKKNIENCSINLIKWLNKNNKILFQEIFDKLLEKHLINLYDYDILNYLLKKNSKKNKLKLINYFCENYFLNKYYCDIYDKIVFSNFEYIKLIINIFIKNSKIFESKINFYYKIFDYILLNLNCDLKFLLKYIKYFNFKIDKIKKYLMSKETNYLKQLISSNSYGKINWFFENINDYTHFIKSYNYLEIFSLSCKSTDINIPKFIFNIIEISGFKIHNRDIFNILDSIIYSFKRNNYANYNEKIIYELINFNIKPTNFYPKYINYYNNIKVYKK